MTPFRLLRDRAHWEGLRAALTDPFFARIAADNRRALDFLQVPRSHTVPQPRRLDDPTSNATAAPWRVDKVHLARGAVAWFLEGRSADAADLVALVDHLLAADWGIHPSYRSNGLCWFDLRAGDVAWKAAFTVDVLADVIGPARTAAVAARIADELLPAYLRGVAEQEWWSACDFNWAGGTHAQAGFAALAVIEDHPEIAQRTLAAVRRGLIPLLEAFPADGGWIEGMMYQTTTLAHLTDFLAAHERVLGDDLGIPDLPSVRACLRHRQEQLGGDGRPFNFSNCNEHTIECWLPQAYWWARRLADPTLAAFEDGMVKPWSDVHGLFHDVEAFWYRDAGQATQARSTRTIHHFAGLDWLRAECGDWWLALRGGRLGGNHGNADLGQLILGHGTTRWLVDPGYGASATEQHSLPVIRGHGQTDRARGPIVRRSLAGGDLHVAVNLREAHPFVLDRWIRHVLVLDGRVTVLIDDLLGADARRLSAHFHLQVRGEVTVADGGATVRQGDDVLHLAVDGVTTLEARPWAWAEQNLVDLSWRPWPDTVAQVQAVIFRRDNAAVTIAHGDGTTAITIDGTTWSLDRRSLHLERVHG